MSTALCYERSDETHRGQSKVDRYKWTIKDSRGEYVAIDKNDLFVDTAYQRQANDTKILEFARSWSWMACGAILVAQRKDGTYFVFDGQHRVMAARKRSDITTLDCLVFTVDEITDEAKGFLKSNTMRKPVTMIAKFKAMIVCEDELALYVSSVLDELGLKIEKNSRPGVFQSLSWAMKASERSKDGFYKTIRVVSSLAGSEHPIYENMCRGIFYLHMKHASLDDSRFTKRMRQVGCQELLDGISRASAYYKKGGERVWGQGILDSMNRGLRNRFYDDSSES